MDSKLEYPTDIDLIYDQYDKSAKELMHFRLSLAYALKTALPELFAYPIKDIIPLIEPNNSLSKDKKKVIGENTEFLPRGGKIHLDLLFQAKLPTSEEVMDVFINLEIQKEHNEALHQRAQLYISEVKEEQRALRGIKSKYKKISNVLSIWLIFNPKEDDKNTVKIERIGVRDGTQPPLKEVERWYVDETIVFINIDEDKVCYNNKGIRFFQLLFSSRLTKDEKERLFKEEFDITLKQEEMEDIANNMCNLSFGIRDKSLLEGELKGKREGRMESSKEIAINLLKQNIDRNIIISSCNCTSSDLEKWAEEAGVK